MTTLSVGVEDALVVLGYYNKPSKSRWFKQSKFISLKSEISVPEWSGLGAFPTCRCSPSYIFTWTRESSLLSRLSSKNMRAVDHVEGQEDPH